MAKFLSYDGVDKNGIRAEVTVQTGTGRIKEIIGRGKQNDDGSYRNVEIVFDPDNPLLKRKVYGLLDTTATELWEFIQKAHADERTVAYRIESQRRNGVQRDVPITELNPTEQIRRILAAVDGHFSHEAKTNPAEDPDNENPSALNQPVATAHPGAAGPAAVSADPGALLAALRSARQSGFPNGTIDTLAGHALAAGAAVADVQAALAAPTGSTATNAMVEDKPWVLWNADGQVNYGSWAVARAAQAEQFALDHLIALYTPAKSKDTIDVTDEIVAQAAAVAVQLLTLTDRVQIAAYGGGTADRQKHSYARALDLVTDAVGKRYPVPVGGDAAEQTEWSDRVVEEAAERLYGIGEVAQGRLPVPVAERATVAATPEREPVETPAADTEPVAVPQDDDPMGTLIAEFGAEIVSETPTRFAPPAHPQVGEPGFVEPDADLIGRLRSLCEKAQVADDMRAVSDWIEHVVGVRSARKVHAPVLEAFCTHYEQAGPAQVRAEVLGVAAA